MNGLLTSSVPLLAFWSDRAHHPGNNNGTSTVVRFGKVRFAEILLEPSALEFPHRLYGKDLNADNTGNATAGRGNSVTHVFNARF